MPRRKNDAYYAPEWATDELLKNVRIDPNSSILEPCSGEGNISSVLLQQFLRVSTNDIDESVSAEYHVDYLSAPEGWFPKDESTLDFTEEDLTMTIRGDNLEEVGAPEQQSMFTYPSMEKLT